MTLINSNKEDLSTIQAKDVTINSCPSYINIAHMHLISGHTLLHFENLVHKVSSEIHLAIKSMDISL